MVSCRNEMDLDQAISTFFNSNTNVSDISAMRPSRPDKVALIYFRTQIYALDAVRLTAR